MGLGACISEGRFAVYSSEGLLWSHWCETLSLTTLYDIVLQREGLLCKWGKVCCWVTVERHSVLTTPYGIRSLDFRWKVCCITKGILAVEAWVRDTHFEQLLMGLGAWTSEGRFAVYLRGGLLLSHEWGALMLTTYYGIGSLDFRGEVCCIVKGRFGV